MISLVALPHGTRTSRHEERHLTGATRAIVTDRGFLLFLGAILIGASIYMQNVATFPLHVQEAGYSTSVYGALQALNGIIVVLLELPITSWTGRRSRTRMVALGTLLVGLAFATLLVAKSIPALAVMVLIWTLGEIISSPVASAFVADRSPEHTRGYRRAHARDPRLRLQPGSPVDLVRRRRRAGGHARPGRRPPSGPCPGG